MSDVSCVVRKQPDTTKVRGEFEPPHEADESRVAAEHLQVGVLAKAFPESISELERPLKGRKCRIDHPEDRVAARKIVPGDGVVRYETDKAAIKLEGPRVLAPRGEVVRLDPDRLDKVRITLQHSTEEFDLEVALGLLTERSAS